jgi:hypothetical protein
MCSTGRDSFDLAQAGANLVRVTGIQSISLSGGHARNRSRRDTSVVMGSAYPQMACADVLSKGTFEFEDRGLGIKDRELG